MDVLGLTGLANYLWTFYDPEPLDKKENKTANTRKKEKSTEENRYDQQQKIPSTRSKTDSTPKTSLGVNSCFFMVRRKMVWREHSFFVLFFGNVIKKRIERGKIRIGMR